MERARAGEAGLLRIAGAQGLADAREQVVGGGEVPALGVEREVRAVVALDDALQPRVRRRRAQLGALHGLHPVHGPPLDPSPERRAAVGPRHEVESERPAQVPDAAARPLQRERPAGRRAHPRRADAEDQPAETFAVHRLDLARQTGRAGNGRHVHLENGRAPDGLYVEVTQVHAALVPHDLAGVTGNGRAGEAAGGALQAAADSEARAFEQHGAVVARVAADAEARAQHVPVQDREVHRPAYDEVAPEGRDLENAAIGQVGALGPQPGGGHGDAGALHAEVDRRRHGQRRVVAEADVAGAEGEPARERAARALAELAFESR